MIEWSKFMSSFLPDKPQLQAPNPDSNDNQSKPKTSKWHVVEVWDPEWGTAGVHADKSPMAGADVALQHVLKPSNQEEKELLDNADKIGLNALFAAVGGLSKEGMLFFHKCYEYGIWEVPVQEESDRSAQEDNSDAEAHGIDDAAEQEPVAQRVSIKVPSGSKLTVIAVMQLQVVVDFVVRFTGLIRFEKSEQRSGLALT